MQIEQNVFKDANWQDNSKFDLGSNADLVMLFGSTSIISNNHYLKDLKNYYPGAHFIGCSTAGEILGTTVSDETLVATAIHFEKSTVQGAKVEINDLFESFEAGCILAKKIPHENLRHVFVLSDGLNINGSDLVKGIVENIPSGVMVSGGLSGDGDRFKETFVLWDDHPEANTIAAIGIYGDNIKIGCGSKGGWDPFGVERIITKSKGNVLFELDGKPALELYKKYLGEHSNNLPSSGLLFPLSLRFNDKESGIVRTILAVNEKEQSMTFAGDVPEGVYARLMKANINRLIDGATGAALTSMEQIGNSKPEFAVLISCVGRKLILKQRVEEEIEAVRDILGADIPLTGFYSYGEISPLNQHTKSQLHNQTMTITTISEK